MKKRNLQMFALGVLIALVVVGLYTSKQNCINSDAPAKHCVD